MGRVYAPRPSAVTAPKLLRVAVFGATDVELDMAGAHYELVRRLAQIQTAFPIYINCAKLSPISCYQSFNFQLPLRFFKIGQYGFLMFFPPMKL